MIFEKVIFMKTIYFLVALLFISDMFSQQQSGNVFSENIANPPVQLAQTNVLINNLNDDNSFNDQMSQQGNFANDVEENVQLAQKSISNSSNGTSLGLSFNVFKHSASTSSDSSSKLKSHKHTFNKRMHKFNRNMYGKMNSHKKSKHLVDVCFNWS